MGGRFAFLIIFPVLAYGVLIFNLYQIQVVKSDAVARASSESTAAAPRVAARGSIYFSDKDGEKIPAAVSKEFPTVFVDPKEIEDTQEAAAFLSDTLSLPMEDVLKKLAKPSSTYELIAKKVSEDAVAKIKDGAFKGIYTGKMNARYYPLKTSAAQVIGFVSPGSKEGEGDVGRYGVEEFRNETLAGSGGSSRGEDVVLTIDPNIQKESENILAAVVKKYNADGGSVIVQDPRSGRILALANAPDFDPNTYNTGDIATFLNPVTQQLYEPGSVFKVLTMAAALDAGKVTPASTFNDTGVLDLNGKKIRNWDLMAHGLVTMSNIIEKSLNTGAAYVGRQLGSSNFRDYLAKFGFQDRTGIDLPGDIKGDLRSLYKKDAPAIAFATASFGQGVAVTPLHVINAFSAIANDGVLMRPLISADREPEKVSRVLKEDAVSQVKAMMVSAVDKGGYANIKGYSLAGKTGTAQIPLPRGRGYMEGAYNHTFVGFGPASDARFTILIKLNHVPGDIHAAETVVTAFRDLAQFVLNYYNIPPDRLGSSQR